MSEKKVLSMMVQRFQEAHGRLPEKIVVAPVALIALGLKSSVGPSWEGVPVECRLFSADEVASRKERAKAINLGVFVKERRSRLQVMACDLMNASPR